MESVIIFPLARNYIFFIGNPSCFLHHQFYDVELLLPSIETGCAVRVADPDCLEPLSSGARNADLPPEHRCSICLASVLPVGRMGAVFLNANGSKRLGTA